MPGTSASGKNLAAAIPTARRLSPVRNHARKVRSFARWVRARESESAARRGLPASAVETTATPRRFRDQPRDRLSSLSTIPHSEHGQEKHALPPTMFRDVTFLWNVSMTRSVETILDRLPAPLRDLTRRLAIVFATSDE